MIRDSNGTIETRMKDRLQTFLQSKEQYIFDVPFRHYMIDDFMHEDILNELGIRELNECTEHGRVSRFLNDKEDKLAISHITRGKIYDVLAFLNSPSFVQFLQEMTRIPNLITDPQFHGGGIHIIPKGGKLGVHVDFTRAVFDNSKYRRVNALLYLNKDWLEEYNGHLELWDKKPSEGGTPIKRILPIFNRLVVFGTKKNSWHGHPVPLSCPDDRFRISLATYYYSTEPGDDMEDHSTIF